MRFGANTAEKRVSRPKRVSSNNCISGFQGRWTLGCCMEAIKKLKSLRQHWFGAEAQENHFNTSALGAYEKKKIRPKCQYWDIDTHGTSRPV